MCIRDSPIVAQGIWWFSFLLDLALIATFTIKFACSGRRVNATPSWTVLYVGIDVYKRQAQTLDILN